MSLPPGFLDELRTRLSLAQVVGRKVIWDKGKTRTAKGDYWAPCPFHQEKSASFHVVDREGYYYCFGCHAKGDAISFVRETENVDFLEAVRILAGEAGMTLPDRDPQAAEKADRRGQLAEVMEEAVKFYRLQLKTGGAAAARAYLARRGLAPEAQARWELGYAPDGWSALTDHLKAKGIPDDQLMAAGLAKQRDAGRAPYDVFRNRIMFPIRDVRGRAIAFGGRALAADEQAKYLNSPQTELFDKSRTLYNHGPARTAAGKGAPLIVAEGYMDVIALGEHGFPAAVAALGTAVTDQHLTQLWRMADEPILTLDGDTAGLRAAFRVIDIALPLLEPGKSLRFVHLPEGMDPDDFLKAKGAGALQALLDTARPLIQLLWQRETEGKDFDSPERKAALDQTLRAQLSAIRDPGIRAHYGQEIKDLRWQLFRPRRSAAAPWRKTPPVAARASTRASALAMGALSEEAMRESVILAVLARTPALLADMLPEIEALHFVGDGHAELAHRILSADPEQLPGAAGPDLETLLRLPHVALTPAIRNPGDLEAARTCVTEELAKLNARRGWRREMEEAEEEIAEAETGEYVTARLAVSGAHLDRAGRSGLAEGGQDFDFGGNGAPVSRDERARLDDLLSRLAIGGTKDRPT